MPLQHPFWLGPKVAMMLYVQITIDNDSDSTATVLCIDSANRSGTLVEVCRLCVLRRELGLGAHEACKRVTSG